MYELQTTQGLLKKGERLQIQVHLGGLTWRFHEHKVFTGGKTWGLIRAIFGGFLRVVRFVLRGTLAQNQAGGGTSCPPVVGTPCKGDALPTELTTQIDLVKPNQKTLRNQTFSRTLGRLPNSC